MQRKGSKEKRQIITCYGLSIKWFLQAHVLIPDPQMVAVLGYEALAGEIWLIAVGHWRYTFKSKAHPCQLLPVCCHDVRNPIQLLLHPIKQ